MKKKIIKAAIISKDGKSVCIYVSKNKVDNGLITTNFRLIEEIKILDMELVLLNLKESKV